MSIAVKQNDMMQIMLKIPCVYTPAKDHIQKIMELMSELGGLWNDQNNPKCTKSVRFSLHNVEVGH